jgi:hypothetical protein
MVCLRSKLSLLPLGWFFFSNISFCCSTSNALLFFFLVLSTRMCETGVHLDSSEVQSSVPWAAGIGLLRARV